MTAPLLKKGSFHPARLGCEGVTIGFQRAELMTSLDRRSREDDLRGNHPPTGEDGRAPTNGLAALSTGARKNFKVHRAAAACLSTAWQLLSVAQQFIPRTGAYSPTSLRLAWIRELRLHSRSSVWTSGVLIRNGADRYIGEQRARRPRRREGERCSHCSEKSSRTQRPCLCA